MFEFDHVGITTTVRQPDENWVEQCRVWVTNPRTTRNTSSSCAYEPDSTVPEDHQGQPHIAFRVTTLEEHLGQPGVEIIIPPFEVGGFLRVVFVRKHTTPSSNTCSI